MKRRFSNYSEKPEGFRDTLLDHSMHRDASLVFWLQPLRLVSDLSNKQPTKWLVTVFTPPPAPAPQHSEVSQCEKTSIPKPSPRTVKLSFSPFSHKSQSNTGNFFLCLQCNKKKKNVYLATIKSQACFRMWDYRGGFFQKVLMYRLCKNHRKVLFVTVTWGLWRESSGYDSWKLRRWNPLKE